MDSSVIAIVISLVALVLVVFSLFRTRKDGVTKEKIIAAVQTYLPIAEELVAVATIGAKAAEQLAETHRIDRSEKLNYALNYVKRWSPALASMENEKILAAVEAAVLGINTAIATVEAVREKKLPPGEN